MCSSDLFAGVLAYSGRLGRPLAAPSRTPIRLVHGRADGVIPAAESVAAEAALKAAGLEVTLDLLADVAHEIDPMGVRLGRDFLKRIAAS